MILCVCWKLSAAEQVKTDCCHTPAVVSTLLTPLPVSCPLTTPHHYINIEYYDNTDNWHILTTQKLENKMLGYLPNLYTMCNCKTVQPCVANLYLSSFTISYLLTFYIWFHFLRYLFYYQYFSDICDPNECFKLKGPSCPCELYSDSEQVCAFLQLSSSSKQVLQIPKIVQL